MTDLVGHSAGAANPRGHAILSVSITCGALETVAVALRFLARRKLGAKLRADDWLIFASLFPNYAMIIDGAILVSYGKAGMKKSQLSNAQMVLFLKTFFASMLTYIITITLVRISILMLIRRIFDVRPFKIITSVLISMCLAWGISITFANIFQCTPVADAFDPAIVMSFSKQCINLQAMFYGTLGTAVVLDTIILVLPLREIWKLQLSTRRKYEISALLSVGGLACIASFMRIVAIGNLKRTDLIYTGAESYMWSQIEPSAAILCACLVTYRPLFRTFKLPGFRSLLGRKKESADDVSRRWPPTIEESDKDPEMSLGSETVLVGK